MNPIIQFVQDLELAPVPATVGTDAPGGFQNVELRTGEEQAFINDRNLTSFVADVSPTVRQDVLDTVLLASLAAEGKYPDNSDTRAWYAYFTQILSKIGWVKEQDDERTYTSGESEFDVDQAIIEIMAAAVGGPAAQALLIRNTLESLRELADEDGKIRFFESRAEKLNTSHFQIGMVTEENEAVSLNVSNFVFENTQGSRKVLFFRWGKDSTELNYRLFRATLNQDLYGEIRFAVKGKLAQRPLEFVKELELPDELS